MDRHRRSYRRCLRIDPDDMFDDAEHVLGPETEPIILLASPVQPHSEGEIVLRSSDALTPPEIRMNCFDDPHGTTVTVAVVRRALDVVANWPMAGRLGPLRVPPAPAAKHGSVEGVAPSDAPTRTSLGTTR